MIKQIVQLSWKQFVRADPPVLVFDRPSSHCSVWFYFKRNALGDLWDESVTYSIASSVLILMGREDVHWEHGGDVVFSDWRGSLRYKSISGKLVLIVWIT